MKLAPATVGLVAANALALAAPVAAEPTDDGDSRAPATARLASVSYDGTEVTAYPTGRLTGTPAAGDAPLTFRPALFGPESYLKSEGFGDAPPESVRQWDEAIDQLAAGLDTPTPPRPFVVIGNARDLMELATILPPRTIVVSYVPDTYYPGYFTTSVMQPVAE